MQRGEGRGFDNCLDIGHVDIVVVDDNVDKMPARDVPTPDTNKDKQKNS